MFIENAKYSLQNIRTIEIESNKPQPTPERASTEALNFWLKIDLYPYIFALLAVDGKTYGTPSQRRL